MFQILEICKTWAPTKFCGIHPPFVLVPCAGSVFTEKSNHRQPPSTTPAAACETIRECGHHVNIIDSSAPAVLSRTPVPSHTPPSAAIQNNSGQFETNTSAHLCSKYLTLVVLSDLPQVIPQFSLSRNCFLCAAARSHAPARLLFHRAAFCGMVLVTFACGFLRLRPWSCRRKIEVTA